MPRTATALAVTAAGLTAALAGGLATAPAVTAAAAPTGQHIMPWQDCPEDPALNEYVTGKNADKGAYFLCVSAVQKARTVEAGYALVQAFWALGSPITCSPSDDREGDAYDSSSLVSRSYAAAGLDKFRPDDQSLSAVQLLGQNGDTRPDFIIPAKKAKPGDILGYQAATRAKLYFVTMSTGSGSVITAAGACGDVVRVTDTTKTRKKGPIYLGAYYVDPTKATS